MNHVEKTNYHVENFHNYIRMLMHCIDKIFQIFQFYTSLPSYILWPILCYFIRSAFVWRAGKLMHLILDSMQLIKFLRVFHIYQDTCQLFLKQYRTKSNQLTYMLGSHGKKKKTNECQTFMKHQTMVVSFRSKFVNIYFVKSILLDFECKVF